MKLLIYSPLSLRFGGGFERWVLDVVPRLRKYGVSTEIICTKSIVKDMERISLVAIQEILKKAYVDYSEVPYYPLSIGSSNSPIPSVKGLKKIFTKVDYDILYFANAYAFQDILICMLKYLRKKPIISGQHAVLFQKSQLHDLYVNTISRSLLKKFDAYHVLNKDYMQFFRKWGLKRVYLIPIGVNTQRFKPKEPQGKHTKFKVLFVGRLTSQKGIDILCKSIELINKNSCLLENMEFVIVGSGSMGPLVQNFTKRYRNVRYLGQVTDKALPKIYSNCDLFVMPSRRETLGIVALEAQACGLPVIASDVSGPRDIIINNRTGTLTLKGDSMSLASTITSFYLLWLRNHEKYKQIRFNARENAVKRFCWDTIIEHFYNMLMNVYGLQ